MEKEQISEKVKEIIAYSAGCEVSDVNDQTNFQDDLGMDSLDRELAIMKLEQDFSIEIQDEEGIKANTTEDIVELIIKKQNKDEQK